MSQTPSIGRIVHYHSYGTPGGEYLPEPRAAIVTAVDTSTEPNGDDWLGERQNAERVWSKYHEEEVSLEEVSEYITGVSLAVLNPTGMFFNESVPYSEQPKPGHWSWPPRA